MKRFFRVVAALMCTLLIGAGIRPSSIKAADIVTVGADMAYGQTEARSMLQQINEFRTGSDAWAWSSSGDEKIYYSGLQKLHYNYQVEEIAMQRAAELALSFGHIRPNGESCFSIEESYDEVFLFAESILAGDFSTAKEALEGWIGDESSYAGQGSRQNILSPEINAAGVGHVYYNGCHYWVLELAFALPDDMAEAAPKDGEERVSVEILSDRISVISMECSKQSLSLKAGKSAKLPEVVITARIDGSWPESFGLIVSYASSGSDSLKWTSSNKKVAKITSNGKIKAVAAGKTTIKATCGGVTATCKVTVEEAGPALNAVSKSMNVKETYTLKLSGATAESFSSNNIKVASVNSKGKITAKKVGTATITVKDTDGNAYQCKVTVSSHTHSWDKGKVTAEASCEKAGVRTYTCTECGETKTKSIAATGHDYVKAVVKPTVTKQGYTEYTCTACGDSYRDDYTDMLKMAEKEVYAAMIALKEGYPEGMPWTNADYYKWNGGIFSGGYGCAAFAFILSDAAFGSLPARTHKDFLDVKAGDIIRLNNDTHSVIVLERKEDGIIVAEGNYNSSIHWGREISFSELQETGTYVMTRYPE